MKFKINSYNTSPNTFTRGGGVPTQKPLLILFNLTLLGSSLILAALNSVLHGKSESHPDPLPHFFHVPETGDTVLGTGLRTIGQRLPHGVAPREASGAQAAPERASHLAQAQVGAAFGPRRENSSALAPAASTPMPKCTYAPGPARRGPVWRTRVWLCNSGNGTMMRRATYVVVKECISLYIYFIYIYTYMYTFVCVIYVCIYTYVYMCIHVCICVYIYVYIYMHICIRDRERHGTD